MSTTIQRSKLLDANDLVDRLTVNGKGPTVKTLNSWRSRGIGPRFVVVGRRRFYRESDVEAWLEAQARTFSSERKAG